MNKTSLPKSQILGRIRVILILITLIVLMPVQRVRADVAPPPDPKLGGVVPYQPMETNVQMISETVVIEILPPPPEDAKKPKQVKVNATFTMRNQGQTKEQMQVIFPLSNLESPYADPSDYYIDRSSFAAKVDGKPVAITEITTPTEVAAYFDRESDLMAEFQIRWAAFEVTFPVQQDVSLEVQYDMLYNDYAAPYQVMGFDGLNYILETGAGWYGNILSADIILRFPYPASDEVVSYANPGYIFSGNEMRWQLRDFEPRPEDNLEVRLFRVDGWQDILELRERVKQNPKDADAWTKLGYRYMSYAIAGKEGIRVVFSPHFVGLAVEARQKVVDLHPDSGDAHYNLAESLWFNISSISNKHWASATDLPLDDPAVQQVLRELELAWAYGAEIEEYDYLLSEISGTFPGLSLQPPIITTITNVPQTQTLAPFATDTAQPTASSVIIPTVSPTSTPSVTPSVSPYGFAILVLAVALAVGMFTYRWKSRSEGIK
jgi:hypothetical protein